MTTSIPSTTDTFIDAELKALSEGYRFTWGRISKLLDLVDRQGYWRRDSASFSGWLDKNSELLGAKRSMLWRYISSGRYYEQLRKKYPNLEIRPLEEASGDLSPENLELLSKIHRAAPENILKELVIKLVSGEAKRSDLRASWAAFRPMLDGRTSRGRGVTPPHASSADGDTYDERLVTALIKNQIANSDSSWTHLKHLYINEFYPDVSIPGGGRFDAVVVTRNKHSILMMHGIKILHHTRITPLFISSLQSYAELCNMLWIALPYQPEVTFTEKLPESIGILTVDTEGIRVIRTPKRKTIPSSTEDLARVLLELTIQK